MPRCLTVDTVAVAMVPTAETVETTDMGMAIPTGKARSCFEPSYEESILGVESLDHFGAEFRLGLELT